MTTRQTIADLLARAAILAGEADEDSLPMERRVDVPFKVKAVSEEGEFEGYGSVFDVIDSYAERIARGAFADSLANKPLNQIALLWQHDWREPIGPWRDMREDDYGLFVRGKLTLDVQRAREARALMMDDAISGLSIGFVPERWEVDDEEGLITLTQVDLWETSLVTFPANNPSRVTSVKFAHGEVPEVSVIERALRSDFGMTRRQARALIAGGYTELAATRDATGGDSKAESTLRDAADDDAVEAAKGLLQFFK
jgi:HK97 family phage prohead protease